MRLIDADELEKKKYSYFSHETAKYRQVVFMGDVDHMPTIDAVPVVHGRWEKAHIAGYLKCNCCQDAFIYEEWLENGKWNYCQNCGARMDGD